MISQLDQLKKLTTVVADTSDFEAIRQFHPQDATTNPSLILRAVSQPQYAYLVQEAVDYAHKQGSCTTTQLHLAMTKLLVNFGHEILKVIPGRVSTEVDARLSFDTQKSIEHTYEILALYKEAGIDPSRVLIKLASTWEGLQAAKQLEAKSIACNMTLIFALPQAVVAGEIGATLISPFVGRIMDWHIANTKATNFAPDTDPGVLSVRQIYNYLKKFGYKTEVMGASFRNVGEVLGLAGCDLLTVSPELLQQLKRSTEPLSAKLSPSQAANSPLKTLHFDEPTFRFTLNEDPMASDRLADGIRRFAADTVKLEAQLKDEFGL